MEHHVVYVSFHLIEFSIPFDWLGITADCNILHHSGYQPKYYTEGY